MIQTVDNFQSISVNSKFYYYDFIGTTTSIKNDKKVINNKLEISLREYQSKSLENTFFSFFKNEDKTNVKNEDDIIISIKKDGDNYLAQTGNYVGKFVWDGLEIDIKSRFSNTFLERMLNFANDIYLDDVSVSGKDTKNELDISKYIIYYMFIQNLEKAFLLGLPKAYKSVSHHEMKLKGRIDINSFIKKDIPFKGKISSSSREQKEISEIIDVLYKTIKIIDKSGFSTKNISHIKTHLKQHRSNSYVSNQTINKALTSKALQNPIFTPYIKVLEYARYIINGDNIEKNKDGKNNTYGFLINVAELFEIYVTKLLAKEFPDWQVSSPKIELYDDPEMFYQRKIIPDIVMIKDSDVMVFDTKYKRMKFRNRYEGADLDRNDFFQINTYMSYYQNKDFNVKVGGLLYPIEENFEDHRLKCHSESWLGNSNTRFIVDGIDLSQIDKSTSMKQLVTFEKEFIERLNSLIH